MLHNIAPLFIAGFLGQLLHILVTILKSKKSFEALNQPFVLKKFFSEEALPITISFVCILLSVYAWDQIVFIYPKIENASKLIFAPLGWSGSSAVLSILSKTSKKINDVAEAKINSIDDAQKGTSNEA